ncbi:hypothetical protein [Pseudomonas putida]|jgi:hypothetical protein|uniref:hypothetical protein n=1 Tax=Pseudomonas putida TaxID=303 RepID=UPI0009A219BB|nr:hypothetical protein [Pseudomonas putida]
MYTETEKYLQVMADIEQAYKQTVRADRMQRRSEKVSHLIFRHFWIAMSLPSVLAVVLAFFAKYSQTPWLFQICWLLIALSYLAMFIYPFLTLWVLKHSLSKVMRSPFASLLEWNVKMTMTVDAQYLHTLASLSSGTLKLGMLELKSERNSFEKRTWLVTGALEKIGIFPGLLALITGLTTLEKNLSSAGIPDAMQWVFAVAVANFFFFILCAYSQMKLVHYDRMVALTELALEQQRDVNAASLQNCAQELNVIPH